MTEGYEVPTRFHDSMHFSPESWIERDPGSIPFWASFLSIRYPNRKRRIRDHAVEEIRWKLSKDLSGVPVKESRCQIGGMLQSREVH